MKVVLLVWWKDEKNDKYVVLGHIAWVSPYDNDQVLALIDMPLGQ